MRDIELALPDEPGALGTFGAVLGRAGVSLEGGGVFAGHAHFLVSSSSAAAAALEDAGLGPVTVNDVVMLRLDQEQPGSLGLTAARFGAAGINIRTQYSDHAGNLILIVDPAQHETATALAAELTR